MTTKLELKRSIVVLARIIKTLCERLDSAEDAINHRPCDYLGNVSVGAQKKCDDIINFLGRDGDIRNVCYECGELTDEVFGCPKDCEER